MGRDGKKGKSKGGRGGGGRGSGEGRMFIANEDELEIRQRELNEQREARAKRRGEEIVKDAEGAEEEEEEEENEEQPAPETVFNFDRTKAALPAPGEKATSGDAEDEEEDLSGGLLGHNPNRNRQQTDADPNNPDAGLSRKQREALAAQRAKEDYMRRHLAGETEQAKKDLERLAQVRARREAAKKQREAEGRAPGWTAAGVESSEDESSDDDDEGDKKPAAKPPAAKAAPAPAPAPVVSEAVAKKKAHAAGEGEAPASAADGGPPKLKAMDIKKMSGDQLKESLKARGLDIQGQKKDLIKRLTDYEAARA